jgi:hypothetical protein
MDRRTIASVLLACTAALSFLLVAPDGAWADSKGKAKNAPKPAARTTVTLAPSASSAPGAASRTVAPTPQASGASASSTPAPDRSKDASEVGPAGPQEVGTITTDEARALTAAQPLPEPAPPAPDPLTLITLPSRVAAKSETRAAEGAVVAQADGVTWSYFPVPAPVLALLLVTSQAALALGIRALRRAAPGRLSAQRV